MNNKSVVLSDNEMTASEKADHERSVHDYPDMQFTPREYVVIDVQRSVWGLVRIWLSALVLFVAMGAITVLIDQTSPIGLDNLAEFALLTLTLVIPLAGGLLASWVFRKNRFIVTNERIFSYIQYSPFSKRRQTIEIEHIEDCSFSQKNIFQILLNYGNIRLSTVGDEHTYVFTFVDRPKYQFKVINQVVQQVDEGEATRYHREL